ncbi:hypothetical protein [Chondromyces crocatus]|uniref:Adhesin domain-containing protein n=1 Tax=Chondromyces crocatus TaxID=52 RepID=A0A0K1ETE4_CHOCO|nr:hypothetical protein [Chondromyces crocatus]AKT44195.1 uncharacterized protein CMC5_084350 [Chondromyces crocatus]
MNHSLQTACLFFATAFTLAGCNVEFAGEIKPATRYQGTAESATNAYSPGLPVRIVSANGAVDVTRGSGNDVRATFRPFVMGDEDAAAQAQQQMERNLNFSVGGTGEIVIEVVKANGSPTTLGADIEVALPPTFDGEFEVVQDNGSVDVDLSGTNARSTVIVSDNGSIDVVGARGRLDVETGNGSVDVAVASWATAGANGRVSSGNGSITFQVPAATNGSLTVTTRGTITEQSLPTDWATAENEFGKSYTMGTGAGAQVDISNADGLGDVTLIAR